MAVSEWDKKYLDTQQQQAIAVYTAQWQRAHDAGDEEGMRRAHEGAEAIRARAGYSGGAEGGGYDKFANVTNPGSKAYNNGSLTREQVKTLQGLLGVSQDGYFGAKTQAAAYQKWGTSDADASMKAWQKQQAQQIATGAKPDGISGQDWAYRLQQAQKTETPRSGTGRSLDEPRYLAAPDIGQSTAPADQGLGVLGGRNPAAVQQRAERKAEKVETYNEAKKAYQNLDSKLAALDPLSVSDSERQRLWTGLAEKKKAYEDARQTLELYGIDPDNPNNISIGERVTKTLSGAGKTYAGMMTDAQRTAYEATQGARDVMYADQAADVKYSLDRAKADLALMQQPGYEHPEDIASQQSIVDQLQQLYDALTGARDAQVGAAKETAKLADQISESGARDIARAKQGAGKVGQLLVDAGVGAAQMAADVGLGLATGGGAMLPMMVRSFGGGAQEARQQGYDVKQQTALGLASAATEYFTEKLFGGNPAYDTDVGLVNKLVDKLTKNKAWNGALMEVLSSATAERLNEGLEEIMSDILNPLAKLAITGDWDGYKADQIITDGVVGVITALIAGAGEKAVNAVTGSAQNDNAPRYLGDDIPAVQEDIARLRGEREATAEAPPAGNLTAAENEGAEARKNASDEATASISDGNYVRINETPSGNTKTGLTAQGGVTGGPDGISESVGAQGKPSALAKEIATPYDSTNSIPDTSPIVKWKNADLVHDNDAAELARMDVLRSVAQDIRDGAPLAERARASEATRSELNGVQDAGQRYALQRLNDLETTLYQMAAENPTEAEQSIAAIFKNEYGMTLDEALDNAAWEKRISGKLPQNVNSKMQEPRYIGDDSPALQEELTRLRGEQIAADNVEKSEPLYIPTVEDLKNGYVPQSSAEYSSILRRSGQSETKTRRENRPSRSKGHLRHELLSVFNVPNGSKATFTDRINAIADEILTEGRITEENRAEMIRALYDAGVVNVEAESDMRNARDTLKGRRIYVNDSIRNELGDDWNSLRTKAMGNGIYFVTDASKGLGVDVVADEMAELLGEGIVDPNADGATQLRQMVDAAEMGKNRTISLAEDAEQMAQQYGEGAREDQINNLERQFDEAIRKFADKAKLEVELKDRADERIEKEKELWRQAFAKKDEARRQREAAAQTLRNLKRLRKRIGMNDTRLAEAMERLSPEEQQIAREALGNISTDAQRLTERAKAKMAENAELYERLVAEDPNYIPDKKTLALLERMDQKYLADLTSEELMNIHRALQMLEQHLTDMNKEIGEKRGEEFSVLYKYARGDIEGSKGRGKSTGIKMSAEKLLDSQLTPMNYLERLGGWNPNNTWNQTVTKQLEEGERARKRFVVEANDMVKDFREKHADWIAKSDGQGKDAIWYDIEVPRLLEYGEGHQPIFGDTVTVHLTPAMRVELARGIRNNDNLRHAEGGVTFPDKELYAKGERAEAYNRGTTVKLAPETMKKLFAYDNLTAEEKALFDLMDTFFDGKAKKAINETSQIMDGIDKAMTTHYSKIYTNQNYRATDPTIINESIEAMPSLQKRVFSKNPMLAMSVWEAFDDTVNTVGKYHGLAIPLRNVSTLINWQESGKSMKDAITQKWGGDAVKYIETLIGDLQNRRVKDKSVIDEITGKLLNNYVTATFGANPGIVLKQFSSFPSAAAVLGVDTIPTPKQIANTDTKLIEKYTPELEYRSMGYATPELAELKNNPNWTQRNKATRFLFGGAIQGMDRFTVKAMWPWAENYVKKHNPDLKAGSDEFYQKTAEVYNEAVSLTQPMYDVMHRAGIMRNDSDLTKAFTMFKTVPLQQQNMLRKAFGEAQNATGKAKTEANRNLARTVGSIVVANLLFEAIEFGNQLWKNAAKKYRDDEDELTAESVGSEIAENALKDMAGMFLGGDETTDLFDMFAGKKNSYYSGLETPGLSQLEDVTTTLTDAVKSMRKVAQDTNDIAQNGGSIEDYVKTHGSEFLGAVKDLAEKMAVYFGGVPATNIEKYLLGTLRAISPKVEQEYKALWDSTTKRDLSGLEGDALQVRVDNLVDDRIDGVSDDAKKELARLYEATGTEVIPSDVPTGFTVDGESMELTAAQEQRYRSAYTDAIGQNLDDLLTSDAYKALDDEAKARAITGLYNYAKASARSEVTGQEAESSVEKVRTAQSMGLEPSQYFSLKAEISTLDELEADEQTEAKISTIQNADLTPAAKSAAYYTFIANSKEKELIDSAPKLNVGALTDTLMQIKQDSMLTGTDKTEAECQTLLDANLPEQKKRDVYRTLVTGTHEDDIDKVIASGLIFDDYLKLQVDTASLTSSKDANGKDIKGQTKRDKVLSVIDKYKINIEQKNALYYAAGYAESTLSKAPWYSEPRYLSAP